MKFKKVKIERHVYNLTRSEVEIAVEQWLERHNKDTVHRFYANCGSVEVDIQSDGSAEVRQSFSRRETLPAISDKPPKVHG